MRITLLCGGVGGSKLALGLYQEFPNDDLRVVVNTGDDIGILGLHISPDVDTVMYTLAGLANRSSGWGIEGDTFQALEMLARYGQDDWFRLGDRDLATHLARTTMLSGGKTLTETTAELSRRLGVHSRVLPMCDEPIATRIRTSTGWLGFQEYFVRGRYEAVPLEVRHDGIEKTSISPDVGEAIEGADVIVAAPSNPVVSIAPIVAIPGMVERLQKTHAPKIAVSPIVSGEAVSGPAAALMRASGFDSTAAGLARMYRDWADTLVVDEKDSEAVHQVESEGMSVRSTDTMMVDLDAKRRLARYVVGLR